MLRTQAANIHSLDRRMAGQQSFFPGNGLDFFMSVLYLVNYWPTWYNIENKKASRIGARVISCAISTSNPYLCHKQLFHFLQAREWLDPSESWTAGSFRWNRLPCCKQKSSNYQPCCISLHMPLGSLLILTQRRRLFLDLVSETERYDSVQ